MTTYINTCQRVQTCEVCASALPPPVLDLGLQPLCDDLVPVGDARVAARYPTQISLCPRCLTAHHLYPVRKELLFPKEYHYRARFTLDVLNGMRSLVEEVESRVCNLAGAVVCDIGCNDGSLLSIFREKGARTFGIEPTGAAADAIQNGHSIVNNYFNDESARSILELAGAPDVVTFTNVFAHIDSLSEAIASLRKLVGPKTVVVIENHYLGAVIANNQFDTFYHEHPRTYSFRSFEYIAKSLGGNLLHVSFPGRYGGNIRVYIGDFNPNAEVGPQQDGLRHPDENDFPEKLANMQSQVDNWRSTAQREVAKLVAEGVRLYGKSFPGRASILINLLALDSDIMPAIFEREGSMKIGCYVPGTRIPIRADSDWIGGAEKPDAVVIWGWHIRGEIVPYMRERGYKGRLISPLPIWSEIDA